MELLHEKACPLRNKRIVRLKLKEQSAVKKTLVLKLLEDIHQVEQEDQQMTFYI